MILGVLSSNFEEMDPSETQIFTDGAYNGFFSKYSLDRNISRMSVSELTKSRGHPQPKFLNLQCNHLFKNSKQTS